MVLALRNVAVGGGAAGRHAAADAAIVGGQEIVARDGGGRGLADADAAIVVLLQAGLQLRHLGHRWINADAGKALQIARLDTLLANLNITQPLTQHPSGSTKLHRI